jgi:hypothetical protein
MCVCLSLSLSLIDVCVSLSLSVRERDCVIESTHIRKHAIHSVSGCCVVMLALCMLVSQSVAPYADIC